MYAHSVLHNLCRPISQRLMQQMANTVKLTEAHLALTSTLTGLLLILHITHFFFTATVSWVDFRDMGQCSRTYQLWLANVTGDETTSVHGKSSLPENRFSVLDTSTLAWEFF